MLFLDLTDIYDRPYALNLSHIIFFREGDKGGTTFHLSGGDTKFAKEQYANVKSRIGHLRDHMRGT